MGQFVAAERDRTEIPSEPYPAVMSPDGTRMAVSGRPPATTFIRSAVASPLGRHHAPAQTCTQSRHAGQAVSDYERRLFSGQEIAAGIADQELGLYFFDANTGQEMRRVIDPRELPDDRLPLRILYSPDGSRLATLNLRKSGPFACLFQNRATGASFARMRLNCKLARKRQFLLTDGGFFATTGVRNRIDIDIFRVADQSKIATWGGLTTPWILRVHPRRAAYHRREPAGRLSIHHGETGETLQSFSVPTAYAQTMAAGWRSPRTGRTLAPGAADGVVLVKPKAARRCVRSTCRQLSLESTRSH